MPGEDYERPTQFLSAVGKEAVAEVKLVLNKSDL